MIGCKGRESSSSLLCAKNTLHSSNTWVCHARRCSCPSSSTALRARCITRTSSAGSFGSKRTHHVPCSPEGIPSSQRRIRKERSKAARTASSADMGATIGLPSRSTHATPPARNISSNRTISEWLWASAAPCKHRCTGVQQAVKPMRSTRDCGAHRCARNITLASA